MEEKKVWPVYAGLKRVDSCYSCGKSAMSYPCPHCGYPGSGEAQHSAPVVCGERVEAVKFVREVCPRCSKEIGSAPSCWNCGTIVNQ